jgi:BolA protein
MTTLTLIETALKNAFPAAAIEVMDDRAEHVGHAHQDSGHFTVIITTPDFEGKNEVTRHRMVYQALGTLMQTHIHALRIKAKTE